MDKTHNMFNDRHLCNVSPQGLHRTMKQDSTPTYSITRYRKTRYWAIWKGADELLAVTVYLRGARAVLEQLNNPTTLMTTTSCHKAGAVILAAKNHIGLSVRLRCTLEATEVSYRVRGEWKTDLSYSQPLPELLHEGLFRLTSAKGRKAYRSFFPLEQRRRKKSPRGKGMGRKQVQDTEQGLWQQVEMERGEEEQKETVQGEVESVMDVEPPAPAPAIPEPLPAQHAIFNVILAGQERPQAIPQGYILSAGDRLVRKYKDDLVEVVVRAVGQYEWNGQVYPTLTHISWKAAGYQISGNAFFGLPVKRRCK